MNKNLFAQIPIKVYFCGMNSKNLVQNSERTRDEREELYRKAGEASGEARRKKRDRREWSRYIGSLPVSVLHDDEAISPVIELMVMAGVGTDEQCWDAVEICRQHLDAMRGSVASFRAIGELNGDIQKNVAVEVAPRKDAKDLLQKLKEGGRL